jgi:hypothetical protein
MTLRTALRNHSADVADVDRRLAELTGRLRSHRGDKAAEASLWQRIDTLLDERLRLDQERPPAKRW